MLMGMAVRTGDVDVGEPGEDDEADDADDADAVGEVSEGRIFEGVELEELGRLQG